MTTPYRWLNERTACISCEMAELYIDKLTNSERRKMVLKRRIKYGIWHCVKFVLKGRLRDDLCIFDLPYDVQRGIDVVAFNEAYQEYVGYNCGMDKL